MTIDLIWRGRGGIVGQILLKFGGIIFEQAKVLSDFARGNGMVLQAKVYYELNAGSQIFELVK